MTLYDTIFDLGLSRLDPEKAHHHTISSLKTMQRIPGALAAARAALGTPNVPVKAFGRTLPGPLGLAAGFDKSAEIIDALGAFGFGFVEVGTITGQPQPGNPKPRLFRLPQDQAVINRMGFNNDGAQTVARRLRARQDGKPSDIALGINIGKTKIVPAEDAVTDYVASAELLAPFADYLVVNVSSPNTPGLRDLQAVETLRPLLSAVQQAANDSAVRSVPVLVKIAPDMNNDDIVAVADLVGELQLEGIIATNTTISRDGLSTPAAEVEAMGAGGLSGPCLKDRSTDVLRILRKRLGDLPTIISVGGISTADDVWLRAAAGATLVQAYTTLIYKGPAWPMQIHDAVADRLAGTPGMTWNDLVAGSSAR